MKVIKKRASNKMADFIHSIETDFIQCIKEMGRGIIELACVEMVNIMKYIPGVQVVDEAVNIGALSFTLIPDELKTQKMCNEAMRENPAAIFLFLIVLKHKRCVISQFTQILGS